MRFASRMLVLQLVTQVCVVAACAAVFLVLGVQQLRAEAESSALNIARSVAAAPDVRRLVAEYSADPGTPAAAELRDGPLQEYAGAVTGRTDVLFVVITDDHGIRLAHPDPARLGEVVSTSFDDALAGREVVTWESGTLGESARAKVPVYGPDDAVSPVGEVSVGFERASVFRDLPTLVLGIAAAVLAALALGAIAALLLRRRLERVTLGVQPEELAALVQTQTAVLESSDDGIVAVDDAGVVRVWSDAATRMLGTAAEPGTPLRDVPVDDRVREALTAGAPSGIAVGDRIVYVDVRPVRRGPRGLGTAAVLRDRTDLLALTERLDGVRTLSDALRAQRHEFANRLRAASGLLDAGRTGEARDFLRDVSARGAVDARVEGLDAVADPVLQSFLGAMAETARERGVELRVGEATLLRSSLRDVEDTLAILGNLVGNAVTAAAAAGPASGSQPWVEVTLLDELDGSGGGELVLTVADSGGGIKDTAAVFAARVRSDTDASIHGLGIGLPLSRELARRRGGDVWVIEAGGSGEGAVFGARLPGVMSAGPDGSESEGKGDE
ncbi:ATP-binding protein [Microbacterium sp. NPDC077663]|uniref:sensor histidine kinase n=1 Tax=Microbacterium sp. NPDC077663 TaxID=3364189 RepID=UPI0037C752DE